MDGLKLVGGIVVRDGSRFMIHRAENYKYNIMDINDGQNGWENIGDLL